MSACQHCGREHPALTQRCPLTNEALAQPGPVGQRLDRYQVERLLGVGGFGAVYRARHVHTDVVVALKVLKRALGADQQMLERFLREARAAASVGSEHIVGVLDAGLAADGQAFLALEYLDGMDLKELASREGPLSPVRVGLIALQVLAGLDAAHARGVVHRDMKPANVFVVRRADAAGVERDFVKLLDFGISKMHGDAGTAGLTMTGVAMGTPAYMAPEQFFDARSVDQRADLYSVAAMLYELLSGRLPFEAESYAHLIVKVRTEQAPPLIDVAPHVPLALAQVVTVGLAKEPHQRWQTAAELAAALQSALAELRAGPMPTRPPPPASGAQPPHTPAQFAPVATPLPATGPGLEATHSPARLSPAAMGRESGAAPSAPPGLFETPSPARVAPVLAPGGALATDGGSPPVEAGWVAPAGASPATTPGWVAPTGAPIAGRPAPPAAPLQAPPSSGSGLRWALILGGLLLLGGGCCACTVILAAASEQADGAASQP